MGWTRGSHFNPMQGTQWDLTLKILALAGKPRLWTQEFWFWFRDGRSCKGRVGLSAANLGRSRVPGRKEGYLDEGCTEAGEGPEGSPVGLKKGVGFRRAWDSRELGWEGEALSREFHSWGQSGWHEATVQ